MRRVAVVLAGIMAAGGCAAASPDLVPSAITQADFASLTADWADRYIACARSFGADAKLTPEGAISNAVAPGRETSNGLDAQCLAQVGEPPAAPAASEAFLRGTYLLLVEQAECLREEGYAISDPPSIDAWVEGYDGTSWNPLTDVLNAGKDVQTADRACPQPDPVEAERLGSS